MLELKRPIKEIFDFLAQNYFDPKKGHCNWGHDGEHLKRMLAMRKALWPAIVADEKRLSGLELIVNLAIVFHDLDRSKEFRGRTDEAKTRRRTFGRKLMTDHGIPSYIIDEVFRALDGKSLPKGNKHKPTLSRIVDDLDKADMGAIGVYRMAAVACERNYGVFARARDFDPDAPAIDGDENLDSFAADICFCLEWWSKPKFAIETPAIRTAVEHRFKFMREFLTQLKREHEELGLI